MKTWPRVKFNFFSVLSITLNWFHNLNFLLLTTVNSHITIMSTLKQQSDNSSSSLRRGRPSSSIDNSLPLHTLLPRPSNISSSRQKYVFLLPTQRVFRSTAQNIRNQVPPVDAWQIFIDVFHCRKYTTLSFLPKLLDSKTWATIKQFQLHLAEVVSDLEYVCTSCSLFIPIAEVTQLHHADLIFEKGISFNAFFEKGLDTCGQNGDYLFWILVKVV